MVRLGAQPGGTRLLGSSACGRGRGGGEHLAAARECAAICRGEEGLGPGPDDGGVEIPDDSCRDRLRWCVATTPVIMCFIAL